LIAPLVVAGESRQNTSTSRTELAELDRLLKSLELLITVREKGRAFNSKD